MEKKVDSIDSDKEYEFDTLQYLRQIESTTYADPLYFIKQKEKFPRWREILVEWLIQVHNSYNLRPETLYITINILDRFCEEQIIDSKMFQLVGATCLVIACKCEEVELKSIDTILELCVGAYTRQQFLDTEREILQKLGFQLIFPSSLRFAIYFIKAVHGDDIFAKTVQFYMESTLQYIAFLKYTPSKIAASATYLALQYENKEWTKDLEILSKWSQEELLDCIQDMITVLNGATRYPYVRTKYSQSKHLEVAKRIPPKALTEMNEH